jgi:hypothetical protein
MSLMHGNGPAIWGGCVTRRSIRAGSWYPARGGARKLSRRAPREHSEQRGCKEGMAHFLRSRYRVLWLIRASRYRVIKELVNYPGAVKFIEGSGAVWVCHVVL